VAALQSNKIRLMHNQQQSLMLVTSLSPHIGYERSAQIAKIVQAQSISLREAAIDMGYVTGAQFDAWVDPYAMV
jgi:fumarate hydratase class II